MENDPVEFQKTNTEFRAITKQPKTLRCSFKHTEKHD